MKLWTDERRMPDILLQLLEVPDIPEDLRRELLLAYKEVLEEGAVTYPTKAKVEYYLYQHQEYISELVNQFGDGYRSYMQRVPRVNLILGIMRLFSRQKHG